MIAPTLKTKRLILRQWKKEDLAPFAAMNADARVTEFFPSPLSREQSDELAQRIQEELKEHPYGLWAFEVQGGAPFIGFLGLHKTSFHASFTPCIEFAWRLSFDYWGKGYATEAALEVLRYAFSTLDLKEIVAFTTEQNARSRKLMERLGMTYCPDEDFDHPKLPSGHPLLPHVLYRLSKIKHLQQQVP